MATEIVMDQNWPANSDGVWEFGSRSLGTVVDVATTGQLHRIDLYLTIRANDGRAADLRWAIRVEHDGLPQPFGVAPLASGLIPGSNIGLDPVVTIDLAAFDLEFESGDRFALCLTGGSGATYRWLSYRGPDAPRNHTFELTGIGWQRLRPSNYEPPYSAGYSTFIELVPEPSTALLAFFSGVVVTIQRRRRRPH